MKDWLLAFLAAASLLWLALWTGDIFVMFNNTDKFTTLESKVKCTYRSSMPKHKTHWEIPPKALINIVFVADNIAVMTVGV